MWARSDNRLFIILLGSLIGLAWLVIWVWGHSPYARFLGHGQLGEAGLQGDLLLFGILFVVGWVIMLFAMMLPTSLPLVMLFRRVVSERKNRRSLLALMLAGYVGLWTVFGVLLYLGDFGLHRAVEQLPWLQANSWVISVSAFLVAGVYQFTSLKYRCLTKCRSPMSFVVEHWHASDDEPRQAFHLGVDHGAFCIGCCWTLMLLMFALGLGNVGWMLVLGAVMAAEKNMSWGKKLSAPMGLALLSSGLLLSLLNTV